jgi:class 3 adenylate cyclase/tetratricopeptide (TPR) repeat protein
LVQTRRVPFCSQCGTDNPDVAKFCFACGSPLVTAPPPQEVRKIVTIVFSDLKGSTAMGEKLDSESLREVMTRYFDAMSAELERHGGVVEKFIGDAIMAVFGLPTVHEDDALRAVRAAADMQQAQAVLNDELERHWGVRLTVRTGVNTGQVVAGDPTTGQRLVTGDAVNVAARLEQAAGAQEVLLGDLTYRLVRDYVDVEEVEPLELKGKAERVPAYRLMGVRDDAERPRRLDAPMVGRERELEQLQRQLSDAIEKRCCRLATVVGEAGVGKSRLIDELLRSVEGEVTILRGRCLPYGDGITFWPLAEAVRELAQVAERDTTEEALEKLTALGADNDVTERVASAIGLAATPFPVQELVWGARRLLESLSRKHPVLVLFEDVHWAEPTFLELVEQVVEHASDSQLLVVCTARHELVERLPEWSTGPDAVRLELQRLTEAETAAVAEHLLGMTDLDERIRARIVAAAEGNPLFIEQLLSMLIDGGQIRFEDGAWRPDAGITEIAVPPTIHALLAARLDALEVDERAVIEPASVIGHIFAREAVQHLAPERVRPELDARLQTLTHKQLVQPDESRSEEDAFRFHHILIRDTAYEGVLKRARATYHEQFVEWADGVNREGATEYEEILGYHLEQAHRYLSELGPLDDHGRALGAEASRRLAAAGRRAFARGDVPAAVNLLGRATDLLPREATERLELLPDYGEALVQLFHFGEAETVLEDAIATAEEVGLERIAAHAALVRLRVRLRAGDFASWQEEAATTIAESMAIFEAGDDHAGLARAWRALNWSHGTALRFGLAAESAEHALEHARLAGDVRQETRIAGTAYPQVALFGPTPVPEAIARCEEILDRVTSDRQAEAQVLSSLASLYALDGSFERARDCIGRSRAILEELGLRVEAAAIELEAWRVEMLAGDPGAAAELLRRAYSALEEAGERFLFSTVVGLLAQTVFALECYDEAEQLASAAKELATEDDIDTQTLWRCIEGKVLARKGRADEGDVLVQEAVDLLEATDALLFQHDALMDLAYVQQLAGRDAEARSTLRAALALAEAKGSPVLVAELERLLSSAAERSVVGQPPV